MQASLVVYPSPNRGDLVETAGPDSSWIASDGSCVHVAGEHLLRNNGPEYGTFEINLIQLTFNIADKRLDDGNFARQVRDISL